MTPNLCGNAIYFCSTIFKGPFNDDRHYKAAFVAEGKLVHIGVAIFFFFFRIQCFCFSCRKLYLIGCAVIRLQTTGISPVKITQRSISISFKTKAGATVTNFWKIIVSWYLWFVKLTGNRSFFWIGRSCRQVSFCKLYGIQRNIAGIRSIEPTSPEPVKVFTTRIFHRTEEVSRFRMFEGPPSCIFFKCIVK